MRVVARTDRSFRLGTLDGNLEAGEIELRAVDAGPGVVDFTIEVWSRAGDRTAELVYSRLGVGREVQAGLWVQFCLGAVRLVGGRRERPCGRSRAGSRPVSWMPRDLRSAVASSQPPLRTRP